MSVNRDDIRSAVAAGILTEAQAASFQAHVQSRQGYRDNMGADDEPFEFFRGFAEIFVTIGLGLLLSGMIGVVWLMTSITVTGVVLAVVSIFLAHYFTTKRRMTLPSMGLAISTVGGVVLAAFEPLTSDFIITGSSYAKVFGLGMVASVAYFWAFRLPFAMFLFGLNLLGVVYALSLDPSHLFSLRMGHASALFDLRSGSNLAFASLGFGFGLMALGLWFDMKDPHRISRYSATGFWLHILAAPALVNTGAMSLFNIGGSTGYGLTAALLFFVTVFAIVIDRRSFLTAGVFYFITILAWVATESLGQTIGTASVIFIIGAFFTAIGTWWTQIRARVMTALPDFPGKDKLPPIHKTRGLND